MGGGGKVEVSILSEVLCVSYSYSEVEVEGGGVFHLLIFYRLQ